MIKQLKPSIVIPPNTILKEEIEARGWTQKDLAEIIGRTAQTINEIIKRKKRIDSKIAIGLSAALGTSAQF